MGRIIKEFVGTRLVYSWFVFGGYLQNLYLLDTATQLGKNVTVSPYIESYLPVSTANIIFDNTFVFRVPLSYDSEIDGRVYGTIIAQLLANNLVSEYVVMTAASATLLKIMEDGSKVEMGTFNTAWTWDERLYGVGAGTPVTRNVGILYTMDVSDVIPSDSVLALRIKLYGYKSSSSTNLKINLLCSPSDGDLKLAIPLVEGEI